MPITTGNFPKLLTPGIQAIFGASYQEHTPQWDKYFDRETSSRNWEEDVGIVGFGLAPIKGEGEGIKADTMGQGFVKRYTHVVYGLQFSITREMVEDDLYMTPMKRRAQALAFSMHQTKEIVHANVLNRGFNSSYPVADALELFSTAHLNAGAAGGTYRNELSTAADLSETAIEQACIDIYAFTDDRGNKIAAKPLMLIIPAELTFTAGRVLESTLQNNTANNAINVLKAHGIIPKVLVCNYLTDTDAWFIKTDVSQGLKSIQRRPVSFEGSPMNDFDTENGRWKATERYSCGCTDPRGVFGSPGA